MTSRSKRTFKGVTSLLVTLCSWQALNWCFSVVVPKPMPGKTVDFLSDEAKDRMLEGKNKFEKAKAAKDPALIWTDVSEYARDLREGKYGWDEIDASDINVRLKWAGFFIRPKDGDQRFMVRTKIPNGIVTSDLLDFLAEQLEAGEDSACMDITTRQNFQLRGIRLDQADTIIGRLYDLGVTSLMSGLDNVRNIVGSPLAGIDPEEIIDTRPIAHELNEMITGSRTGNPKYANLPRKANIAISGSTDDFAHTGFNDIGLRPVVNKEGEVGFNFEIGGFFSAKRNAISVPIDLWIPPSDAPAAVEAMLTLFRDHGERGDRAKTRLMYLVESWGADAFKDKVVERMKEIKPDCRPELAALPMPRLPKFPGLEQSDKSAPSKRRDVLGVHSQKQEGKSWVGVSVPAGRLSIEELRHVSRLAREYSGGEARLTVEQNVLFPNVANDQLERMLDDPALKLGRLQVGAGNLVRGLVSCTGSQYCPFGIIDTKDTSERTTKILENLLDMPDLVRFHWTGCPNQCGVPAIGDIGFLGGPAKIWDEEKQKAMATSGVRVYLGGKIGEHPELGTLEDKSVPLLDEYLIPHLCKLLIERHNAKMKPGYELVETEDADTNPKKKKVTLKELMITHEGSELKDFEAYNTWQQLQPAMA